MLPTRKVVFHRKAEDSGMPSHTWTFLGPYKKFFEETEIDRRLALRKIETGNRQVTELPEVFTLLQFADAFLRSRRQILLVIRPRVVRILTRMFIYQVNIAQMEELLDNLFVFAQALPQQRDPKTTRALPLLEEVIRHHVDGMLECLGLPPAKP
jgi:hypothetical protein